jgi:nitrogen fixation/metabolism regulation signal transduction histidine kinase
MPGAHPQRRKQSYLLDPRFQLKWTGYLVAVVLAVMASLGWIIARTASDAATSASIAVEQAKKAAEESRTNSILARQSVMLAAPEMATVMNESLEDLDKKEKANVAEIQRRAGEVKQGQRDLQLLLAGAGVALLVLLVGMGVVITHRIVGPVHKMKRLLRRVSTGRLVIEERLRKGDELEDLFDTFLQMTYSLRATQRARLATLDSTLKHAESSNTPKEVIEGLRALRAQMVLGLERRRPSQFPMSER